MLTFVLLGILLAIIYVSDGWRSAESGPVYRSPKVRGLVYLLGGGIIPIVEAILSPGQTSGLRAYITAFTLTTLTLLLLLILYALAVSYRTIKQVFPRQTWREAFMDSWPHTLVILLHGIPAFNNEIGRLRLRQVVDQRNFAIDFLLGFYDSLVTRDTTEDSTRTFLDFADKCLEAFLLNYLEDGPMLERYRASIYVYIAEDDEKQLRFLTGVSPETAPHSAEPLPVANSLAGYALKNPTTPHRYSSAAQEPSAPFFQREAGHRYNSVIACAIRNTTGDGNDPDMVLSIDSVEQDIPELSDYMDRMTLAICSYLSHVRRLMYLSTDALRDSLA